MKAGRKPRFKTQRRLMVELPGLGKPGALERKPYPPGQHGMKRKKFSDFGLQLEEKQKVLFHYGIREKQLRRFIRDAKKGQAANWTDKLIGLLERRLDNLVFRLGFAPSIRAARQMVSHGHVLVNGRKADVASMVLKVGDEISLRDKMYENQLVLAGKDSPRLEIADFLERENKEGKEVGRLKDIPSLEAIPFPFSSGLFTEYYSIRGA